MLMRLELNARYVLVLRHDDGHRTVSKLFGGCLARLIDDLIKFLRTV